MARYSLLVLLITLLVGCAQVGRLTGGEKDRFSPTPIEGEISPPNRSTNFTGNEITFLFNEFIRLDNPAQNIVMIPPHAKIKTEVKGKKLILNWEEELKPNTTYSIYLKEAVQDITEANDSIIQYVFSTGGQIDSLEYRCVIIDAFSGEPKSKLLVALFDPESGEILNFAETNSNGIANLRNLNNQTYTLIGFDDSNKNLTVDPNEGIAFKEDGQLNLSNSTIDSIPFFFSIPQSEPKIRTFKYLDRGRFVIGSTADLVKENVFLNNELIDQSAVKKIENDSLLLFIPEIKTGSYELIVQSDVLADTLNIRVNEPKTLPPLTIRGKSVLSAKDSLTFVVNDHIKNIDKSLIRLYNPQDSIEIIDFTVDWSHDEFFLHLNRADISKLIITIDSGAIVCSYGANLKFTSNVEFNPTRKYGNISVDLSAYENQPIFVELIRGNKTILSRFCENESTIMFNLLEPGEYSFRVVNDVNKNQKWDTGDFAKKRQPEVVDRYSKVIQLRANWDVNVPLVPEK